LCEFFFYSFLFTLQESTGLFGFFTHFFFLLLICQPGFFSHINRYQQISYCR
jgi:hypothetical protein